MYTLNSLQSPQTVRCISVTLLSLMLLASPGVVLAHGGHGDEFQGGNEASQTSVNVDTETAKRLGIKVEPVKRQSLAVGIKSTGQVETLPSQQVEVTTPISGVKVVELLVEPGTIVKKDQPVAVLTSPDLVTLRVESQEKLAQSEADSKKAEADLELARQDYKRYQQIVAAEVAQAQSQVAFAQEKYDKDNQLANAGALARRTALESQTQLQQAKAELTKANNSRDVIDAQAQVKRAQAAVEVAKKNINLSHTSYSTRLAQLGTIANAKGLITITAPINGKVADREVTIGQSFQDAGGKLMTIVDDSRVFATANIYEKDLGKIRIGQRVNLKVASLPDSTFTGRIAVINSVVTGETRVIPVKTQIDNPAGVLKPGMFAELEVLTDQTSSPVIAIPTTSVVDANGKKLVYLQNGNTYQAAEVSLGQTSGNMVEVKTGLFEGDMVVTERAPQLYAQSLRGGNKPKKDEDATHTQLTAAKTPNLPVPLWLMGIGGGGLVTVAFIVGAFWSSQRNKLQLIPVSSADYVPEKSPNGSLEVQETAWDDNHHSPAQDESKIIHKK